MCQAIQTAPIQAQLEQNATPQKPYNHATSPTLPQEPKTALSDIANEWACEAWVRAAGPDYGVCALRLGVPEAVCVPMVCRRIFLEDTIAK